MKKVNRIKKFMERVTGITLPSSQITLVCGSEITLSDCERILEYESGRISVRLRDCIARVYGSGLTLDTYMTDRAVIRGQIDGIELERE